MKQKGISLITLIVTIIVLVLIASITISTGGNMLDNTRVRSANDRLTAVATAIASHEKELGFSDRTIGDADTFYQLTENEYRIMGLEEFATDEKMPPVLVYKGADSLTSTQKVYELKTPKVLRQDGSYEDEDYVSKTYTFYDEKALSHVKVEFDTVKGVNRPLLTEDMTAVRTYFDNTGAVISEPVEDIYQEDWYDYSFTSPNWANMKIKDQYYVWIPRFAYHIQDFYLGMDYHNIPSSAINILFLRGTTNYTSNEEVLPVGYEVHPAFQYQTPDGSLVNLPGIWVSKYNVEDAVEALYPSAGISSDTAVEVTETSQLLNGLSQVQSHLIKNTEWAAVAYLSFATVGKTEDGSSLSKNASAIFELNVKQFVAAGLESQISSSYAENFNRYKKEQDEEGRDFTTYSCVDSLETKKFGDAILATSSGTSGTSAWFGGESVMMSAEAPFLVRGLGNNLFAYSAITVTPGESLACRNVLTVDVPE